MKSLRCICCAVEIKSSFDRNEDITKDNVNTLSFVNGMAGTMTFGYGCELDTNTYMFGICEDCTRRRVARGHMILVRTEVGSIDPDMEKLIGSLPKPMSKEQTYENVIALIRQHVDYYEPFGDSVSTHSDGTENIAPKMWAKGSVESLKEVLDHFEEKYDGHKAGCCNPEEHCTCGYKNET